MSKQVPEEIAKLYHDVTNPEYFYSNKKQQVIIGLYWAGQTGN